MTPHFVDHDGLRFNCVIDGPDTGPWMVFSNSLVTDLSLWEAQISAFSGHFRILRYDQRGHGGTDVPAEPATIGQLARLIRRDEAATAF